MKRFNEWIQLKEKLDNSSVLPQFSVGEIWWCNVGENIGSEINGKSKFFTRPVLIFIKFTHKTFFGIPLTSKVRQGTWYSVISFRRKTHTVVLNQARTFNAKRLVERIGQVDETNFAKVKAGLHRLFFDIPFLSKGSREIPEDV